MLILLAILATCHPCRCRDRCCGDCHFPHPSVHPHFSALAQVFLLVTLRVALRVFL